ncbi:MAG: rhodanese-like domain-containing protein [Thioalkalivibrionaceae bacterium]
MSLLRRQVTVWVVGAISWVALAGSRPAIAGGDHAGIASDAMSRKSSAEHVSGATRIDAATAWTMFRDGVPFVDVRVRGDYEQSRIPGAVNLPIMSRADHPDNRFTEANLSAVVGEKDRPVVLYCNAALCWRTEAATRLAVAWGWTHVAYFRDGFPAWRRAGLPVE